MSTSKSVRLAILVLIDTMAIDESTGLKPENIHFCSKISGPGGKGTVAKTLGITHMIDDHDEALKAVYLAQTEGGQPVPPGGQFFHFARSGSGSPPSCHKWRQEDRPETVYSVSSWKEVMALLNVPMKSTQYNVQSIQRGARHQANNMPAAFV